MSNISDQAFSRWYSEVTRTGIVTPKMGWRECRRLSEANPWQFLTSSQLNVIRRSVKPGFRDEDGIWHDNFEASLMLKAIANELERRQAYERDAEEAARK